MTTLLIFPPIVTTGFGSYYPSLAVLSGHLEACGIPVRQLDLNQQLARTLLSDAVLDEMGGGVLPGRGRERDPTSMPAVAARLLAKNRSAAIDDEGRLRALEGNTGQGYLLALTCKTLLVDEPVSDVLARLQRTCAISDWYRCFYDQCGLRDLLRDPQLRLVGISVPMGPQLLPALLLAECIKRHRPDLRVVMGGATLSLMHEGDLEALLAACTNVDAVVRYEGENALLELARQAKSETWSPLQVGNVSAVSSGGRAGHCAPRAAPKLDELARAVYSQEILKGLLDPELGIVQTRGCYWGRCAYCDFVELYDGSPKYRTRTPESFVEEVEHQIARHGVRRFSLITEAIPPSFARRFSELVLLKGLRIQWSSFAMVDRHFTEAHFQLMKEAGCESLVIGLETMVDRVLSLVHKYATSADNAAFIKTAAKAGLALRINLIPDLPSTSHEEALHALRAMRELEELVDTVTVFPFEATRSSQIGRDPKKYGLIPVASKSGSGQALFAANHLSVSDPGMTPDERASVVALYQQFADHVNARKFTHRAAPDLFECAEKNLRIACEDIDVVNLGDEARLFNCRTREQWKVPASVAALLGSLSARGPIIPVSHLRAAVEKHPGTRQIVQGLIDTCVLVPCHD